MGRGPFHILLCLPEVISKEALAESVGEEASGGILRSEVEAAVSPPCSASLPPPIKKPNIWCFLQVISKEALAESVEEEASGGMLRSEMEAAVSRPDQSPYLHQL